MPGVMMVMMAGHELLYYNILGLCKAGCGRPPKP